MGSNRICPDTIQVEWVDETGQDEETTEVSENERLDELRSGQPDGSGSEQTGAAKPERAEGSNPEREGEFETAGFAQTREGERTYLTCVCETVCDDEEAMIADNRPEGLLPVVKKYVNGQMRLFYEITGKQSLSGHYGKKAISYKELGMMLLSVHSCLNRMEEYLLSEDCLVFCPAYVYTNITGGQLYFVYIPSPRGTFAGRIRELAHFFMEYVDYQDERAVALAGQFYQYTDAENFSMTVFLEENRAYFEEADAKKEQKDQEGEDGNALAEERQTQGAEDDWQEIKRQLEKRKHLVLAGLCAIAVSVFAVCPFDQATVWSSGQVAARSSAQTAQTLLSAGVCAGAAAVFFGYRRWAKRTLVKKEQEIYLFSAEEEK